MRSEALCEQITSGDVSGCVAFWFVKSPLNRPAATCNLFVLYIVSKRDWLGKPVIVKVENNGAVGYVKSSQAVYNPLLFVHKFVTE